VQQRQNGIPQHPILAKDTLAQQVYEHLRRGILANDYPPGKSLREETLANRFAVSRVPVREALRRLAAEGFVTLTPRQGATVSSLSAKQFLDAYQVREALEALAIRLAIPNLTDDDLAALEALNDEMRRHAAAQDTDAFFEANAKFHDVFVERADNDDLNTIYTMLIDRMRRYRWPSLDLRGGMERSTGEHDAILAAVRAGDADEAARLLAAHIHVPQRILAEAGAPELKTRS
jgi:DNA-binding GntR family transcriptional regulator